MALPTTGPISFQNLAQEFNGTPPVAINQYYAGQGIVPSGIGALGEIPRSGLISLAHFRGYQAGDAPNSYVGPAANTYLGAGVCISDDGTIVVARSLSSGVRVFSREGTTLTQTASFSALGQIALSGNGNTLAFSNGVVIYIYVRWGSSWTLQHTITLPTNCTSVSSLSLNRAGDYLAYTVSQTATVPLTSVDQTYGGNTFPVYTWHTADSGSNWSLAGVYSRSGTTWAARTLASMPATAPVNSGTSSVRTQTASYPVGGWGSLNAAGDKFYVVYSVYRQSFSHYISAADWTTIYASQLGSADLVGRYVAVYSMDASYNWSTATYSAIGAGAYLPQPDGSVMYTAANYVATTPTLSASSTWTQLTGSDITSGDGWGASPTFSADGSTLAIGAYTDNTIGGASAGSVRVFTKSGSSWSEQAVIQASDANASDQFGWAMALSGDGNVLIVGAPYTDTLVGTNSGSLYVFLRNGTEWST